MPDFVNMQAMTHAIPLLDQTPGDATAAVAERPRDASCLSVGSFDSAIPRA